jgi:protein tyrosine phosphatase (PTP) superfamily phosphohydrolase (DUF442 family)
MRFILVVLLLVAGCAGPARFTSDPPPVGIARFARVDAGLARGARPGAPGLQSLAGRGYRTVVSLRHDDDERAHVTALGMRYVEIPMKIGPFGAPVPTDAQARAFLAAVMPAANRPAFVHCHHGRDRTGVMVALYRVRVSHWTPAEAAREMDERGLRPQYRAYRRWVRGLAGP